MAHTLDWRKQNDRDLARLAPRDPEKPAAAPYRRARPTTGWMFVTFAKRLSVAGSGGKPGMEVVVETKAGSRSRVRLVREVGVQTWTFENLPCPHVSHESEASGVPTSR